VVSFLRALFGRAVTEALHAMDEAEAGASGDSAGSAEETAAAAVATVSASAGATSDEISTGSSTGSAESGGGLSPRKEKEKERRLSVDLGLSPEQAQDIFVIQEQVGVTPQRALEAYRAHGEDLTETVMSLFDEGEMERTAAASPTPSPVAAALPQGGGSECSDVESPTQHHDGEQQSATQMPPALIMTAAKGKSTTRVTLEVRAAAQLLTRTCVTLWRSHSRSLRCACLL
jgi:NACalpha-BTF3-like transcription factor